MKLVQLTMVTGTSAQQHNDEFVEQEGGEDDGLTPPAETVPAETTSPVMVVAEKVRNFYPRKPNRQGQARIGTRLTFDNGSGMAVTETFEEVAVKFGRLN